MVSAFSLAIYQLGNKSLHRVAWVALIESASLLFLLWLVVSFVLFETEFITFGEDILEILGYNPLPASCVLNVVKKQAKRLNIRPLIDQLR